MSVVAQFMTPLKFRRETLTASAGQTVFNLSVVSIPNSDIERVIITINGREQDDNAITVNSTTQFTVDEALELNDIVIATVPGY